MAPPQAPATEVAQPGQQPPAQQSWTGSLAGFVRMAVFWYFAMQMFGPKKVTNPDLLTSNLFTKGENLDLWVYLSEQSEFTFGNDEALVWHETNIPYAVWTADSVRHKNFTYNPSEAVQRNGTLYAYVFFARSGFSPDPESPDYVRSATFSRRHPFVVYLPKPKVDTRKSLLSKDVKENSTEPLLEVPAEEVEEGPREMVSFLKPNVTINLVEDFTRYPRGGAPPHIAGRIHSQYY